MAVHLFGCPIAGTPAEPKLLGAVTVRQMANGERERFDEELLTQHYLKNATAVGRVLRYVAEYQGHWVALLVFSSAAFHLKVRDQWLHWSPRQLPERLLLRPQFSLAFLYLMSVYYGFSARIRLEVMLEHMTVSYRMLRIHFYE